MIKLTDTLQEAAKLAEIARQCKITRGAVSQWDRVPAKHVLTVEVVTGISRHELRPDIYGPVAEVVVSSSSKLPADASSGDGAGAPSKLPAQPGAPVINSHSPEVLPSGEAVARCEIRQRAAATNSVEAVR
jgi:DNA-binding transcriptional regulator YdaS (Cro superfamily)